MAGRALILFLIFISGASKQLDALFRTNTSFNIPCPSFPFLTSLIRLFLFRTHQQHSSRTDMANPGHKTEYREGTHLLGRPPNRMQPAARKIYTFKFISFRGREKNIKNGSLKIAIYIRDICSCWASACAAATVQQYITSTIGLGLRWTGDTEILALSHWIGLWRLSLSQMDMMFCSRYTFIWNVYRERSQAYGLWIDPYHWPVFESCIFQRPAYTGNDALAQTHSLPLAHIGMLSTWRTLFHYKHHIFVSKATRSPGSFSNMLTLWSNAYRITASPRSNCSAVATDAISVCFIKKAE